MVIVDDGDTSAQSSRTLVPNTDGSGQEVADSGSGREASAILILEVRAQQQSGQKLAAGFYAELEHIAAEVTSMKNVLSLGSSMTGIRINMCNPRTQS